MPPLRDAEIRDKICLAFEERTSGGVEWDPLPTEWIRKHLDGYTTRAVGDTLHQHLVSGGTIFQAEETRDDYRHCRYHYDFRIRIDSHKVYVETVLTDSVMGPVVTVVNAHPW